MTLAIEVFDMIDFIESVLKISVDGVLSVNELILIAIAIVILLIVLVLIKEPLSYFIDSVTPGRKKTIFRHRKNQYKNRIGKTSKSSKKTK